MMNIGDRCFAKGGRGTIVGQLGSSWIIAFAEVYNTEVEPPITKFDISDITYAIPMEEVEPLCERLFKIGDRVEASFQGNKGFIGRVTGFEWSTNRVICLSEKVEKYKDRRVRFAYKVAEIQKETLVYEFELNHKYKDQAGVIYRTIEVPGEDRFMLINDSKGTFITYVDKQTSKKLLLHKGIKKLEDISKINYKG